MAVSVSFPARAVVGGAAVVSVAAAWLVMRRVELYTSAGAGAAIGVPLVAAVILACVAWRCSRRGVRLVAREILAFGLTLLLVESLIAVSAPELASTQLQRARVATKLGLGFDVRTKSEVVAALRAQGMDALPGISREWSRQPRVRQQLPDGLLPLSHASNAAIVECNEDGSYRTWQADEFGFNNPRGLIASRDVDIAAVGASFTLGHCVRPEHSLIGRLRASYPRIANFGMAGSATLSMLATFREYVEPLRPPLVLWIMHPWTADLRAEAADPVLARYTHPAFSQRLMSRQAEVDRVWREIAISVQYEFDRRSKAVLDDQEAARFSRIVFLPEIRQRFDYGGNWRRAPPAVDLKPFDDALRLAHEATERWGGKLVVLIMPLYAEVAAHQMQEALRHDGLAQRLRGNGIEVIDVAAFAQAQHDPRGLYTMRISNHPHVQGYALLTRFIEQQLRERFEPQLPRAARTGDGE